MVGMRELIGKGFDRCPLSGGNRSRHYQVGSEGTLSEGIGKIPYRGGKEILSGCGLSTFTMMK